MPNKLTPPVDVPDATLSGFAIDCCGQCGGHVGLRSPTSRYPASSWMCRRCGSVFFARCNDEEPDARRARLVPYPDVMQAIIAMAEEAPPSISQREAKRLVQLNAARLPCGRDARRHPRYPLPAQVIAVPLAADMRVAGQPARVMTVNISRGGAALLFPWRVMEPYLAIDFSASGVDLLPTIFKVTRTRFLASAVEVGGEFVSRIMR